MKKVILSAMIIASGIVANAQSPTTVTPVVSCTVFKNFNTTDEGFSSPSIYSDGNDVEFRWNSVAGNEQEISGLGVRTASLISPGYTNPTNGQVTVGFSYVAPVNTEYRVRVISAVTNPPLEIIATTANGPVWSPLPSTSGNICIKLSDLDIAAGAAIRFEFTFRASSTPGVNIIFDNLSLSVSGAALPVTFEGFVARLTDEASVKLLWNVSREINVMSYDVEASTDGVTFNSIGNVAALGKTVYSLDYNQKLKQTTFFRIKNIDADGRSKYSPIIKIYAKDKTSSAINVYPTPARDIVTVEHSKFTDRALIGIYTQSGVLVQQKYSVANTLQTQLLIGQLPAGLYFIKYDNGKGDVQNVKLVKL